jgi:phosphatidylinositol 4-kinase B
MLVHKPSPSLDKFVIDACSKSLRIALKVHWILMAELEDEEGDGDVDGVARLQEQCQIAATLNAEWVPLVKPPPPSPSPASPKSNPVMDRIRSSKQKLLSLASPGEDGNKNAVSDSAGRNLSVEKVSSEDNKLFRRLSIGPQKVRDALFSKKSMEKDEEELQLDGKDRDRDKDGFFKRLLRDSRDKEEDGEDKEGFFKRLLRDSKEDRERDRTGDEDEREGFLKRILFKDKAEEKKEERDEDRVGNKSIEEEEREGSFFKRLFKDKIEGGNEEGEKMNGNLDEEERDGFFKRLFKDKNEERTDEEDNFFKRLFKDKNEERREEKKINEDERSNGIINGNGNTGLDEGEKENFFKRLFRDKHEDETDMKVSTTGIEEEENPEFLSFRKLFRVHPEEAKSGASTSGIECSTASLESSPGTESFFKRLFRDRDRSVEDSELFGSKSMKEVMCFVLLSILVSVKIILILPT